MTKRRKAQCFNPVLGEVCEACGSWFETVQGVMTHQSNSKKCAWYKKGKLRAFYRPIEEEDSAEDGGKDIEVSAAMASLDVGDLHDEWSSRCEIDIL